MSVSRLKGLLDRLDATCPILRGSRGLRKKCVPRGDAGTFGSTQSGSRVGLVAKLLDLLGEAADPLLLFLERDGQQEHLLSRVRVVVHLTRRDDLLALVQVLAVHCIDKKHQEHVQT